MTQRILLLGARGQLGWELARTLAPLGEVTAATRQDADLAQPDQLRSLLGRAKPNLIVNAAAYTAVDQAEDQQEIAMATNGRAPGVIAQEADRLGARVVHYSTDYVFDGLGKQPYKPEDQPDPVNAYGRSKLAGEEAIRRALGAHLILRTSWVWGLRGSNFLRTMLRLAHTHDTLRVVDDQVGAPTWSRAIAEATALIVARWLDDVDPAARAGTYHLTNAGQTSWRGFADAIFEEFIEHADHRPDVIGITTHEYPTPARRPAYSVLDCGSLSKTFGVRLPDWRRSLRHAREAVNSAATARRFTSQALDEPASTL